MVRGARTIFLQFRRIGRIDPIGQGCAQIRERISDGAHLPIEYSHNFSDVTRIQHHIVVLVVVVDKRSSRRARNVLLHPLGYLFHFRMILGLRAVVALDPAELDAPDSPAVCRDRRGRWRRNPGCEGVPRLSTKDSLNRRAFSVGKSRPGGGSLRRITP